ncbi:MAG: chemotaxis protein CheW [Betaproteobacteria bacterium]
MSNSDTQGGGIDMSQFFQVFFDETAEHLASMESLLIAINPAEASSDDLNAIFRAAHSIKGGAGTFGFTDMTDVTHVLETLLDRVRKNEMQLTSEMVDVFLQAGDVIKTQLAAHRGGGTGLADTGPATEVCERLKLLTVSDKSATAAPGAAALPAGAGGYDIAFSSSVVAKELDILFGNLRALGTLEIVSQPKAVKRGKAAQRCELRLVTAAPEDQVRELFEFIKTSDAVEIKARPAAAAPVLAAPVSDSGFGFFDDAVGVPQQEADAGFGFFTDITPPAAERLAPNPGRRATDQPEVISGVAGRRDNDKVVVAPQGETSSIRVSVEKVDTLINLVGELVITQAMLSQNASQLDPVANEKLLSGMAQFDRNTRELQESVMSIRMMPISFVFSRFPRVVRDLAGKLNKQVELKTEGEGTELDKGVIEKLSDPLTHLVRNSLDHGIESPAAREAAGKPAKGTITLRAFHRGGNIMVEVLDDGAGLDREKLLAKARERGMTVSDSMSDQEVFGLIFEAGFSTAAQVTDVSGRGVGMDVVRRNIREIGGSVEIGSNQGGGTRISIKLPLTLAILDGMSVGVGQEVFIIPLTNITESLQPKKEQINTIAGLGCVVQVRADYVPVLSLHEVFNLKPKVTEFDKGIMVVLESEGVKTALFVDELLGQHQVVIKSLETNFRRVEGVSGATIMGDGRVALILDVAGLVNTPRTVYAKAA